MDYHQFQEWLKAYGRAWEERDAGAVAALFSEDAVYYEKPFVEPAYGRKGVRDYWINAVGDHRDIRFNYEILTLYDGRGIACWQATFTLASNGHHAMLDGIFFLKFEERGLCQELREWWFYQQSAA